MSILILVFIVVALAAIAGVWQKKSQNDAQQRALATLGNFTSSISYGGVIGGYGIAIDASRNQFALLSPTKHQTSKVFAFSDLVAVEVRKDGSSVQKTNRGSQAAGALVGAALLGPAGLLLGGLTGSKRNVDKIDQLSLMIYTNDIINPAHEVVFFNTKGTKADSSLVKLAMKDLENWHGRFMAILRGNGLSA